MQVVPAVDLLGDDAVRLRRGAFDQVTVRGPSWLHVVDLDGARSGALRIEVLAELIDRARPVPVQVSGGIRSLPAAHAVLAAGAARVVIGTAAFANEHSLHELTDALGDALVVALDVRDGTVMVRGWTAASLAVEAALDRCRDAHVARILCTAIDRDGTAGGPDVALLERVCAARIPVMAAGGIRSSDDIARVEQAGCDAAIIGSALFKELATSEPPSSSVILDGRAL